MKRANFTVEQRYEYEEKRYLGYCLRIWDCPKPTIASVRGAAIAGLVLGIVFCAYIENIRQFGVPAVVAINAFPTDTEAEYEAIKEVALAAGAREAVGKMADSLKPEPDDQGRMFIPNSPKVLFGSKLADPGTRLKINFTAPTQPGDYTYVCTFPGHWMRMFGTLVGAFIIAVIRNGMNLTGVEAYHQKVVLGLVILGAVLIDLLKKRDWRTLLRFMRR